MKYTLFSFVIVTVMSSLLCVHGQTDITGVIGRSVTLRCNLSKTDPPQIRWVDWVYNMGRDASVIYDGKSVNSNHTKKGNLLIDNDYSLSINTLKFGSGSEAGEYICYISALNFATQINSIVNPDGSNNQVKCNSIPNAIEIVDQNKILTEPEYRLNLAQRILEQVPLIDGHNDLPWLYRKNVGSQQNQVDLNSNLTERWPESHTDIPRLHAGKVGGVFWSIYTECDSQYRDAVQRALEQVDLLKSIVHKYPDTFQLALSSEDIMNAHHRGKIASLMGLEGGHHIGESFGVLRQFYELGIRYLTLTHNCNTLWADSCCPNKTSGRKNNGLSDWGKLVVTEMNRLGMLIDLSHVSPDVMSDALETSIAPVIFSHSSAYALCQHPRNVPDNILRRMKANGGIVMVNFYPRFLNCTKDNNYFDSVTLQTVADHIEYIRDIAGEDHVGIGSDYDGIEITPEGMEDVSKFPDLLSELLYRGWTVNQIGKLAGYNLLRVMRKAEQVKFLMQSAMPNETPIDVNRLPDKTCYTERIP